ncbi:hypothetical protein JRQ81_003270 [Phrynocephalus forsythii]|uniref:Uncharacterized protein n=1 Tax=Phrynocephalus forsythii TaxID=171643 RepID=A0A9Q0XLQ1_9SAUR|nr:hypothetical protein JRQ81_003270 [Phrynocephalus forsythii]
MARTSRKSCERSSPTSPNNHSTKPGSLKKYNISLRILLQCWDLATLIEANSVSDPVSSEYEDDTQKPPSPTQEVPTLVTSACYTSVSLLKIL